MGRNHGQRNALGQKNCNECNSCPTPVPPTPAPTTAAPPTAAPSTAAPAPTPPSSNCQSWCAVNTKPWSEKCAWRKNCNECDVCPTPAPTEPPQCQPDCYADTQP